MYMHVCMKMSFIIEDWSETNKHDWIINETAFYLNLKIQYILSLILQTINKY